ncbi:hypothetical protein [Archangium primigenium]|uniref:hypothetical protein n=1 Tax=[Archangium] primigenium TaxID=2792470 RepID=UPI00195630B1|nr:hypothetical protein [Archangium primigenium]MBM7115714.1 hypothetical protein [Archangium primigenium]
MTPLLPLTALPDRPVEVDAARLLLVVNRFATTPDDTIHQLRCWPARVVSRYLTPEYYLQKLDFLVRYPAYLAYELVELHRLGVLSALDATAVQADVRTLLGDREPELRTDPFRRFWRGAYESLDRVEAWWHARGLVFVGHERRGAEGSPVRPQKYFFLTPEGERIAISLVAKVGHARWYEDRISLIHRYFGALRPAEVKSLQYSHPPYREAQLNEFIPDLAIEEIERNFAETFGCRLGALHG